MAEDQYHIEHTDPTSHSLQAPCTDESSNTTGSFVSLPLTSCDDVQPCTSARPERSEVDGTRGAPPNPIHLSLSALGTLSIAPDTTTHPYASAPARLALPYEQAWHVARVMSSRLQKSHLCTAHDLRRGFRLSAQPDALYLGFVPRPNDTRPFLNASALDGPRPHPQGFCFDCSWPIAPLHQLLLVAFVLVFVLLVVGVFWYLRRAHLLAPFARFAYP